MKNVIFFIGFMGAGKTTIGRQLAEKLNINFVDLDEQIEKSAGCIINQIFAQHGEDYFRDLETKELAGFKNHVPTVVATGGGVVGREKNWELMRSHGKVFYLHADWDTISERLVDISKRPLANNGIDELYKLWVSRLPLYREADVVVDTNNLSVDQIVAKIADILDVDK